MSTNLTAEGNIGYIPDSTKARSIPGRHDDVEDQERNQKAGPRSAPINPVILGCFEERYDRGGIPGQIVKMAR